jgi:hypothetical protein
MVAKGPTRVGGPLGLSGRKPGQAQREDVGQHMPGVRKQGQGVRQHAADDLRCQDHHCQEKSQAQRLFRHPTRVIMSVIVSALR